MPKFFGKVGYEEVIEAQRGIWLPEVKEYPYVGDILRQAFQPQQSSESENDELRLSNIISIVADRRAYEHSSKIRYVCFMGQKWKVTKIEIRAPRLELTLGGVYNDHSPEPKEEDPPSEEPGETEDSEAESPDSPLEDPKEEEGWFVG